MRRRKSNRHQNAANIRWRTAEHRAAHERTAGIHDRETTSDVRLPIDLDLRSIGGRLWRIEPRLGYLAWRLVDATTGEVAHSAAIKTLLRHLADTLPQQRAPGAMDCGSERYSARDEADARATAEMSRGRNHAGLGDPGRRSAYWAGIKDS